MWFLIGKGTSMKRTIHWVLLASLFLVAPAVAVVQAQQTAPSKGRAQPAAKITEEQAKKIALERIPGEVTDVAIEKKRGKNVYVIEIQSPEQGEKDVFVDIETGKIIGTD
ncbi:PepSY domain-containing protein [Bradyrhizobium sp. 200]|nr:PepSY domain-containing protein [Bradyrhizobium sp. 200]